VPILNLSPVDEVIAARENLHGGGRGAPPLNDDQQRIGEALNRAAMVTLASLLETYIADVFDDCVNLAYSDFDPNHLEKVRKQLKRPHTTSTEKIRGAFLVLGVEDVLNDLSWRNCANRTVVTKLDAINQIRNRAAHGNAITLNGQPYALTLQKVRNFRNYSRQFGDRFCEHARSFFQE